MGATEALSQVSHGSRRAKSRPATAEQDQDQHGRAGKHQGQAQRAAAAELGEQSGKSGGEIAEARLSGSARTPAKLRAGATRPM